MDNLTERKGEEQLITKQELLRTMYISNSQLYRWKRMGLIPQEWFIKETTRTGQRTVFPRNLIVPRVRDILEYKDDFRLGNIEKIVSPDKNPEVYEIYEVKEINENIYGLFGKSTFTYTEILIMIILADFQRKITPEKEPFEDLARCLMNTGIDSNTYVITFIEYKGEYFTIISNSNTDIFTDMRHNKIAEYDLYEVSAYVLSKYGNLIKKDRKEEINEAVEDILKDIGG